MDERFIPLATIVRAAARASATLPEAALPAAVAPPGDPVAECVGAVAFVRADVVHEFGLMRLAALEAFEVGAAALLKSLASDVLARELLLAPADIDALAKRALAAFVEHEPVRLAVSAADAARVHAALPVRIDASLEAGDLVVEVRDGALESRRSLRLQEALGRAIDSRGAG